MLKDDALEIFIPGGQKWDEVNEKFITTKDATITLKHSLLSISKWEAKWHKPFLDKESKTDVELLDYIKCMTLTQNVDPNVYINLTKTNMEEIVAYIDDPMTATWFSKTDPNNRASREVVTSELIYYWMIANNIPSEYQKWHLNRLITLIRVCSVKNAPPPNKKTPKSDLARQRTALNNARRAQYNSKG